ncbi:hypothetical protein ACFQY0_16830 [Haloferula chungangensis]|uniref:Uncharacterized protein n=1 Tax=Haloferula chungangensis TaxID=1048331 RepID=A0ABW2LBU1_9BACT
MFRARSKLQRQDQESGLVFSWRVSLTSKASLVLAVLLVGLVSVGLATLVRVRGAQELPREKQRASLVLVPSEGGGHWLEALAIEAGPYPFPWNPAADPAYAALRGQALREAGRDRIPYQSKPLPLELSLGAPPERTKAEMGYFPPLPEVSKKRVFEQARETTLGARVIRSGKGPSLQLPRLPLAAKDAVAASGRRFLVGYQSDGRVREVTPLSPEDTPADLVGWLGRARVRDHQDKDGWLVVESTVEP